MPIAKFWPSSARPSEPVVRAAALTPITRPSRSTRGPPELPGLSAVSVWIASWYAGTSGAGSRNAVRGAVGGGIAERRAGGGDDAAGRGDRVARRRIGGVAERDHGLALLDARAA